MQLSTTCQWYNMSQKHITNATDVALSCWCTTGQGSRQGIVQAHLQRAHPSGPGGPGQAGSAGAACSAASGPPPAPALSHTLCTTYTKHAGIMLAAAKAHEVRRHLLGCERSAFQAQPAGTGLQVELLFKMNCNMLCHWQQLVQGQA